MDMSGMDHGDSGMDMGGSSGAACKISMLWNWYSVDTCFLSSSWHNTSKGMFAGSVIGVFILVILIEAVRRAGREFDRYLSKNALGRVSSSNSVVDGNDAGPSKATQDLEAPAAGFAIGSTMGQFTPSWPQQVLRGLVYGSHFTASFLVMLLGMYYNGYILFAIFIGHTIGYILFARDTCLETQHLGSGHCC